MSGLGKCGRSMGIPLSAVGVSSSDELYMTAKQIQEKYGMQEPSARDKFDAVMQETGVPGGDLRTPARNPKLKPIPGDVFRKRNVDYTVHPPEFRNHITLKRPLRRTGQGIRIEHFSEAEFQKWVEKAEVVEGSAIREVVRLVLDLEQLELIEGLVREQASKYEDENPYDDLLRMIEKAGA